MTRILEGKILAYLTERSDPMLLLGDDHNLAVSQLVFSLNEGMESAGWTRVGVATISIEIPDQQTLVENKVASLKAEQTKVLADAQAKHTDLDRKIQTLLAISYEPQDTPDEQPGYSVDAAGTFDDMKF